MPNYSDSMNEYERKQWERIDEWRRDVPSFATRTFSRAAGPTSRAVQKLIPGAVLNGALELVQGAAERLADRKSILARAGVSDVEALRRGELERCDQLAVSIRNRGALFGGGTGTLFGLAGAPGMALDAASLLVLSFRTIHRIGLCYGYECGSDRRDVLGVFALASANDPEEKRAALELLDAQRSVDVGTWRDGVERAAERELAKEAVRLSLNNLSHQFARRLGWRLGAGAIPVLGAAIGGGVNAWYLYEVATAAQRTFQLRWLNERYPGLAAAASALPSASAMVPDATT
jgi:hypothetical protein